jgi:hypothetical protein
MICSTVVNMKLPRGEIPFEPADFFTNLPRIERRQRSTEEIVAGLAAFVESTKPDKP